jgi:hypothetical protein
MNQDGHGGGECPNCLSDLEADPGDAAVWCCPVCQFARRVCAECGGEMWKQVDAPDDVAIEAAGLPLERCDVLWVCQTPACGARLEAEL